MKDHAVRPGRQTSEFWVTLILTVIASTLAVVVAAGYLTADEAEVVKGALTQIVEAVVVLVGVFAPVVGAAVFTWSRTRVKEGILFGDRH